MNDLQHFIELAFAYYNTRFSYSYVVRVLWVAWLMMFLYQFACIYCFSSYFIIQIYLCTHSAHIHLIVILQETTRQSCFTSGPSRFVCICNRSYYIFILWARVCFRSRDWFYLYSFIVVVFFLMLVAYRKLQWNLYLCTSRGNMLLNSSISVWIAAISSNLAKCI